jgi:hypothetical protein
MLTSDYYERVLLIDSLNFYLLYYDMTVWFLHLHTNTHDAGSPDPPNMFKNQQELNRSKPT